MSTEMRQNASAQSSSPSRPAWAKPQDFVEFHLDKAVLALPDSRVRSVPVCSPYRVVPADMNA